MRTQLRAWLLAGVLAATGASAQADNVVRVYIDADMTGNREAGACIEWGVRTAFQEANNQIAGRPVEVVVLDHHGNTNRSRRHLEQYLQDERALAVFSGMHSPPILANRDFINEHGILLLDPWAAAGDITRYPSGENWIFRLSVDDRQAGVFLVRYALHQGKYHKPALLLETTGWGKSNEASIGIALAKASVAPSAVVWFNWGVTEEAARILLRNIADSGADVVFLVANTPEGKTIAKAMASLPPAQRRPICSHWGITGGDFPQVVGPDIRKELSLKFIQTRFSFLDKSNDPIGGQVFVRAKALFPEKIHQPSDLKAPDGFIHAYDLTRLLLEAGKQATLTGKIEQDRRSIRDALENLREPVRGLIKTYRHPFGPFDAAHPDAHEALGLSDLVMGQFGAAGEILIESTAGEGP